MKDSELFQMALGLAPPWKVVSSKFNLDKKRLDIEIDFPRGSTLTIKQTATLENLQVKKLNLKTMRAYHIRLNFQELWNQTPENAEPFLEKWYFCATHSRLEPIKQAAYTIKRHWNGILRWFKSRINNGILEGINSLVQAAKARARGYRTTKNLTIIMIYLIVGKLKFDLPT